MSSITTIIQAMAGGGGGGPPAEGFTPQSGYTVTLDSGTLDTGGVITITKSGGGFGTKPYDAKPLLWIPCTSGSSPSSLGRVTSARAMTELSYSGSGGADGNGQLLGDLSSGTAGVSNVYTLRLDSDSWASSTYDWNSYGQKTYIYRKFNKTYGYLPSKNIKHTRIWSRTSGTPDAGSIQGPDIYYSVSNGRMGIEGIPTPYEDFTLSSATLGAKMDLTNQWVTEEIAIKSNSNDATADADYRWAVNGGNWLFQFPNTTWMENTLKFKTDSGYSNDGRMRINIVVHEVVEGTDGWVPLSAGNRYSADDIYCDDSWCRVMVGDSATYNSQTAREIQIPSAWSDTAVTVTLHKGGMSSLSGKHLFVVDNNDNKFYVGSFT